MGLSTWSVFRKDVNETLVRQLADAMVSSGMAAAGYTYLLVDDGWEGNGERCTGCLPNRDRNGRLVVDPTKFPTGNMSSTAAYVHSKGLKFGLWFGHTMCAPSNDTGTATSSSSLQSRHGSSYPATLADYAALDAEFFASNGVDAVKHDNCVDVANTTEGIAANTARYAALGAALNKTGRPILYDVVLQVAHARTAPSYDDGYVWSPEIYGKDTVRGMAHMWWSLPVNKYNCWSCCVGNSERIIPDSPACSSLTGHACRRGLLPMLDAQDMGNASLPGFSAEGHWDYGGPGGWNHLDQLAACVGKSWYGPGFTPTEQVSQMSLWAVLASPLLVSMDVRTMTSDCVALITNQRALDVHQDSAGIPGRRLKNFETNGDGGTDTVIEAQLWGRPLATHGAVAVVFFNRGEVGRDIVASFSDVGIAATVKTVTAVDVWSGKVTHGVTSPITATAVAAHGVTFLTLTPE